MKNNKLNILNWAIWGGISTLIIGIVVYFFINYKISILNYAICLSILVIIASIYMGFRAWYFNKEYYEEDKEEAFNNLKETIKSINRKDINK